VLGQESYFETVGRPSLLQHLWSLAIEEQFYVLWPLVFAVGMGIKAARWRRRGLLVAVLVGSAGSVLLMAIPYQPGVDPSRIYYGTDTRAAGLLVGSRLPSCGNRGASLPRSTSVGLSGTGRGPAPTRCCPTCWASSPWAGSSGSASSSTKLSHFSSMAASRWSRSPRYSQPKEMIYVEDLDSVPLVALRDASGRHCDYLPP
jgi:hypothetical protein